MRLASLVALAALAIGPAAVKDDFPTLLASKAATGSLRSRPRRSRNERQIAHKRKLSKQARKRNR